MTNRPPNARQLRKLAAHVQELIAELIRQNTIPVHYRINQSYYMQKAEELHLLHEQVQLAQQALEHVLTRADIHYREIYFNWRRDIRWLKNHTRK